MAKRTSVNAIVLLKKDHAEVKKIFDGFEDAEGATLKKLADKAIKDLKIHAKIEEEFFYPALRKAGVEQDLMEEADEEHHVAKVLIAELDLMKGAEDNFKAKCIVLAESVRHHIKEEESEIFPKARKAEVDLKTLGQAMAARKQELSGEEQFEPEAEDKMVEKAGLIELSPAKQNLQGFQFPSASA